MAEHESSIGQSDEWYTPPSYFDAFGITFALDPCSPGSHHWVPAQRVLTKADDGLKQDWGPGPVFVNPPFGGRHGQVPWLRKFLQHGDGIAIVRAYTSSDWWHEVLAPQAETMLFPRGKTKFIRGEEMRSVTAAGTVIHPAGSIGDSPGHGVVLIGMGDLCNEALDGCGLGWFVDQRAIAAAITLATEPMR